MIGRLERLKPPVRFPGVAPCLFQRGCHDALMSRPNLVALRPGRLGKFVRQRDHRGVSCVG